MPESSIGPSTVVFSTDPEDVVGFNPDSDAMSVDQEKHTICPACLEFLPWNEDDTGKILVFSAMFNGSVLWEPDIEGYTNSRFHYGPFLMEFDAGENELTFVAKRYDEAEIQSYFRVYQDVIPHFKKLPHFLFVDNVPVSDVRTFYGSGSRGSISGAFTKSTQMLKVDGDVSFRDQFSGSFHGYERERLVDAQWVPVVTYTDDPTKYDPPPPE